MDFSTSILKTVIQILHDGARGFEEFGSSLRSPEARELFLKEAQIRLAFAQILDSELARFDKKNTNLGGTTVGTLHRSWGELKGHLGGGDHALVTTASQGEDVAVRTYRDVLDHPDLPSTIRPILLSQLGHLVESHRRVKQLLEASAPR